MLKSQIESLLLVATKPMSAKMIFDFLYKQGIATTPEQVNAALIELGEKFNQADSGINILETNGQFQMATNVANSELIKGYVKDEKTGELTQPALETLTIIAYRGPITKPVLEQIRGVNCSLILRNLMIRGLVDVEERDNGVNYFITPELLRYLGINKVTELPDFAKLNVVENLEEFLNRQEENQNSLTTEAKINQEGITEGKSDV